MAWCRQATSHYLDQCLAKFACHYLRANELINSQTVVELTDFYLVVCMASNLIFRKQRYSGRRRSYIYLTWQCRIAISSTLIRGLCRQGYNPFSEGGRCRLPGTQGARRVSPLCFADHAVKQSVMHAPDHAATSATPGSQWHKTMLGQSHHGINSYKGRHKQRNRSKRFPIYRLRRPTRLHRKRRRHTQEFTGQEYDG